MDPSVYVPSPAILTAFAKAFSTSFQNFPSTNGKKRFFVAVDVRPSLMNHPVFGAQYLKIADVIACLLAVAVRKEGNVQTVAFSDGGLAPINVSASMGTDEIIVQLMKLKPGEVNLTVPLTAASQAGSNFIVIVTDRPPTDNEWFQKLRQNMAELRKDLRVALWFTNSRTNEIPPLPVCDDVLVVNGWNQFVPEVIWSFARGELDEIPIAPPNLPNV